MTDVRTILDDESPKDFFRTRNLRGRLRGYEKEPIPFRLVPIGGEFVFSDDPTATYLKADACGAYFVTSRGEADSTQESVSPDTVTFPCGWDSQQIETWLSRNSSV